MFLSGPLKYAANGRNPNAPRQKYGRADDVFMQSKRSLGRLTMNFVAKSRGPQRGFEGSLTHAHRDHDWLFVMRRACYGKGVRIVAFTSHAWARKDKIGMLPSSEFEAVTICVKPERHSISGDPLSIH
jgi:hypothetical protein